MKQKPFLVDCTDMTAKELTERLEKHQQQNPGFTHKDLQDMAGLGGIFKLLADVELDKYNKKDKP